MAGHQQDVVERERGLDANARPAPAGVSSMREGPLPALAGAVLDDFGRVDSPMRKCKPTAQRIQPPDAPGNYPGGWSSGAGRDGSHGRRRPAACPRPATGFAVAALTTSLATDFPAAATPDSTFIALLISPIVSATVEAEMRPGAHGVLDAFGEALEHVRRRGIALRVLRLQELDVVEHLVQPFVRQRLEPAQDPFLHEVVHRYPLQRDGLPRTSI